MRMNSPPTIAAVIPTRDRSTLVRRAVSAALWQTRPPAEIIVVDDASTDDTAAVISTFGGTVRLVTGTGAGAAAARNLGVKAARSDWIAFLDSDDVWREGHLDAVSRAIVATGGAASLYFTDAVLPDGGTAWAASGFSARAPFEILDPAFDWAMRSRQPMMMPAVVVRREAYLHCGGQDAELPCREDTHLFFALGLDGAICAIPERTVDVTDDAQDARLTGELPTSGERYWAATARLYEDILARSGDLDVEHVRELERRLATAHWRLGRLAWRDGRLSDAAGSAWRSAREDPRVILGRFGRRA